jgi:hypothetical protein
MKTHLKKNKKALKITKKVKENSLENKKVEI